MDIKHYLNRVIVNYSKDAQIKEQQSPAVSVPDVVNRVDEANSQEPVAYLYKGEPQFDGKHWSSQLMATTSYELAKFKSDGGELAPLYTSPMPAQCTQEVEFLKRELIEAADIISANTNLHPLAESMRMAATQAPSPRITEQDVKTVVAALVKHIEHKTCLHEETHRGGFIWEICDSCGQQWADDNGGKPEFKWPSYVDDARTLLNKLNAKSESSKEVDHHPV